MERTEMDDIVEKMAEYICDHICQKPKETTDQEELEAYCVEECDIGSHICDILNQFNEINDFKNSELHKIMIKYRNIVLCKECKFRGYEKETDLLYCRLAQGMGGILKENDGCSRGLKVSESDA